MGTPLKGTPLSTNFAEKTTYHITFDKCGEMRYISHLDLMRLFARALRRASFKLYLSQGFNPHPIIRIKNALKLGLEGKSQEAEVVFAEEINADIVKDRFARQLPDGIEIKDVRL